MAVHTYVGARYVPKFVGVYDPTQSYEALDVVDNGSGTSYIAKIPTPAGTPLTDTDHWFLYGSSSGAIVQLQNDMIAAQGDIITLQGDMTAAQNDISDLQSKVAGNDIRLVAFTDSYGTSSAEGTPFIDQLDTYLGLSASDYFGFARGSVGITPNTSQPRGVQGLVEDSVGSITNPNTITHVLFALGANDIDNLATIAASFASLVTYTRTEFPNAKIMFAFIGTTDAHSVADKNAAVNAYRTNATINRCVYIENADLIMRINGYQKSDKVHPSSAGSDKLAECLAQGILNGIIDFSTNGTFTITVGADNVAINYQVTNNVIKFSGTPQNLSGPESFGSTWVSHVTSGMPVDGVGAGEGIVLCSVTGEVGGVCGLMLLNNGNMYFKSAGAVFSALSISIPEYVGVLRELN